MVLDFGELKNVLMELHDLWDHGLILETTDPLAIFVTNSEQYNVSHNAFGFGKFIAMEAPPTAENLAMFAYQYIAKRVDELWPSELMEDRLRIEQVIFYETPTSSAIIDRRFLDKEY